METTNNPIPTDLDHETYLRHAIEVYVHPSTQGIVRLSCDGDYTLEYELPEASERYVIDYLSCDDIAAIRDACQRLLEITH
jgi:hypothetical protein